MTAADLLERLAPAGSVEGVRAERGRAWLVEHGLPTSRDEAWRYTPVDRLVAALGSARPAPTDEPGRRRLGRAAIDDLAGDHGGSRLVVVNGVLDVSLSDLAAVPGVWLGGAAGLRPRRAPGAAPPADEPADGFHALNWAAGRDVAAVLVDPGAVVDEPIHVVHLTASVGEVGAVDDMIATHPRTVVRVGAGARVTVVETFVCVGGRAVVNASTRVVAATDSVVAHQRVVSMPGDHLHLGRTGIEQAAGSSVRSTSLVDGGDAVRNAVAVRFDGDHATADLAGLYRPIDRQHHDTVVTVDHAASHCTSRQRFKGIVADRARGSFSGHVIVRPGTVGTDATQANPNLVLAPTAQADTRPWLEIFADDVKAAHGSTVGRLDEEALFYLRSRGIPAAEARSVLIDAFAAEIVDRFAPRSLRDHVAAEVFHDDPERSPESVVA